MFPALDKLLSENLFFQTWKKNSIIEQLFWGPPPILKDEFGEPWIKSVGQLIGEGPISARFLARLANRIEKVRTLEGYNNIKTKLLRLDEEFYPTISELEFLDIILEKYPHSLSSIRLEHTFSTLSGKNPELQLKICSRNIFFEVTRVMDYHSCNSILYLYNMLSAFQIAQKILGKNELKINVTFKRIPDEKSIKEVYDNTNYHFLAGNYHFDFTKDDFSMSVDEGNSLRIEFPSLLFESKLKQKIEEESQQFDKGELNIVVIDVTPMVGDIRESVNCVKDYFRYTDNQLVSAVFLLTEDYIIENLELIFRKGLFCVMNPNMTNQDSVKTLIERLCHN